MLKYWAKNQNWARLTPWMGFITIVMLFWTFSPADTIFWALIKLAFLIFGLLSIVNIGFGLLIVIFSLMNLPPIFIQELNTENGIRVWLCQAFSLLHPFMVHT